METTTTNPNVTLSYEEPIQPLKEGEHHSNAEIVKKLNEVIKRLNKKS